ncbi:MAG: PAS domain S-box protein [Calditrichaceae bacterium]
MSSAWHILHLEDNDRDADLIQSILLAEGVDCRFTRVDNQNDYLAALDQHQFDLILADYSLPQFDGLSALKIAQSSKINIPFVFVSGSFGEEIAIETLKMGATDYVLKERLNRLAPAVKRAYKEAEERKKLFKAEQTLRDSEERFRKIFEEGPLGMSLNDMNFRFTDVNNTLCQMLGYSKSELLNKSFLEITHPDDASRNRENIEKLLNGESQTYQTEKRYLRKDGSVMYAGLTASLIRNNDGSPMSLLGMVDDITERKKMEIALVESEKKYRTIFEESRDVIFISSPDGRFLDVNPIGMEIFGYDSMEDFIGIDIAKDLYQNPEDRNKFLNNMERFGYVKNYEILMKKKSGEPIVFVATASVVRDDNGNLIGYRGVLRDVTENRQLERQLFQAQKMESIGMLAGGVAHDFNNILTVINGHAEMMLMKMQSTDAFHSDAVAVLKAGKRASNLTRQLLAFSRKQIIEPKIVDVNKIINDLDKMLHRLIGEDISIQNVLYEKLGYIKADQGQIEQIIINLVVNARDAINQRTDKASEKKITIETYDINLDEPYAAKHLSGKAGPYAVLAISDTGTGMPDEIKEKIFEPFFTTKKKGEGTGLGLSTVYGIVKQNEGSVEVYSEIGKGTTFKIYWPCVGESEITDHEDEPEEIIVGGNETILFVEDDYAVRGFACETLRSFGYNVIEAENGLEALEIAYKMKFKDILVISDVIMPEMGGDELGEKLKNVIPGLKVLFASGYTDNHIVRSGVLKQGVNFIHKPYSVQSLAKKVRSILDQK